MQTVPQNHFQYFYSTNVSTNLGRMHATSMDDVYVRSSMTSDASLYDPVRRRHYSGLDTVSFYFNTSFGHGKY